MRDFELLRTPRRRSEDDEATHKHATETLGERDCFQLRLASTELLTLCERQTVSRRCLRQSLCFN